METEKKKRGRPPKRKAMEFEGMTYEGAINHALDQEVRADLDKCLANKDKSQLTDDERKYLKRKKEKKSYTLNVRFTESEMQDILSKCEQYGYKNKTEYIRDCVRLAINDDLAPALLHSFDRLFVAVELCLILRKNSIRNDNSGLLINLGLSFLTHSHHLPMYWI